MNWFRTLTGRAARDVLTEINHRSKALMATLKEIVDAIADLKAHITTETGEVSGKLAELNGKIQELRDQIAAGTAATAEDLDGVLVSLQAVTAQVDGIIPNAPAVPDGDPT